MDGSVAGEATSATALLSPRQHLTALGEGPRVPLPYTHLLPVFEAQAARTPHRRAVVCGDDALDYAALDARANQLAWHLRERGVGAGARVGICLPRGIDLVVGVLAVLKTGAAYLPLDTAAPAARIAGILEDAAVAVTLTVDALRHLVPASHAACLVDAEAPAIARQPVHKLAVAANPDAPIYVIYTSGSTGQPKGAACRHRGFANLLHWYASALSLGAADRVLMIGAFTFDAAQKNLFAPLLAGGELHMPQADAFDPESLAAGIAAAGITWINGTPSTVYPILEGPAARAPGMLRSLRWVVLGGETINAARLLPWLRDPACQARILNTYGPTECTDICAAWAFDAHNAMSPVPLGGPIDNVRLAVVDEAGAPVPAGAAGELWIGGAGVGLGYVGRAALTAERFVTRNLLGAAERWYRTGDRVRWNNAGLLEFLGRTDHQVKLRGFRIELGEIEAAMLAHADVREAVVVLREDGPGEARLVAWCVSRPGVAADTASLRRHLAERLPAYMVPADFVWCDHLALTPNGKVDRLALPEPPRAVAAPAEAPGDRLQAQLLAIWRAALRHDAVGIDDNLFDLGGTSLTVAEIQSAIGRQLGRQLPVVALFANPTIRRLAALLTDAPRADVPRMDQARDRAARQAEALRRLHPARNGRTG
ncbi:non-ribosomal peptide synthetase [Plastoroseomonas arctica]|uniref:Non-ribosomal peptide synthetase n=1 Tax=Plastoroseomonas arctica TaxID=1509237 RepID=A0AAF1JYZ3_9PROT|nr:non-ribosomal peptide synthetase [Plastoroseomonas arctica]MBR0657127.1 non-ribosomal peptide synthetase [Plastoroseomonas arctica]